MTTESDLHLLQAALDTKCGGDEALFAEKLATMQHAAEEFAERNASRSHTSLYREVGNRCLVFFTNTAAMDVCEANPDQYRGIIVGDFDVMLDASSRASGTFFKGSSFGASTRLQHGSEVNNSYIMYAKMAASTIEASCVSNARVSESTISRSFAIGRMTRVAISDCYVSAGALLDHQAEGMVLSHDPEKDRSDSSYAASRLGSYGIVLASD